MSTNPKRQPPLPPIPWDEETESKEGLPTEQVICPSCGHPSKNQGDKFGFWTCEPLGGNTGCIADSRPLQFWPHIHPAAIREALAKNEKLKAEILEIDEKRRACLCETLKKHYVHYKLACPLHGGQDEKRRVALERVATTARVFRTAQANTQPTIPIGDPRLEPSARLYEAFEILDALTPAPQDKEKNK